MPSELGRPRVVRTQSGPSTERPLPQGLALVCRTRTRLCALPLRDVIETMRPLPVAPLAGVPPFVRGLSVIRGIPVPVVDLGAILFGLEPPYPTRFVTLRLEARRVALALEAVLGIRELPGTLTALPPLLLDASSEAVSAIGSLDEELLLVLEATRLVPDSLWPGLAVEGSR